MHRPTLGMYLSDIMQDVWSLRCIALAVALGTGTKRKTRSLIYYEYASYSRRRAVWKER